MTDRQVLTVDPDFDPKDIAPEVVELAHVFAKRTPFWATHGANINKVARVVLESDWLKERDIREYYDGAIWAITALAHRWRENGDPSSVTTEGFYDPGIVLALDAEADRLRAIRAKHEPSDAGSES